MVCWVGWVGGLGVGGWVDWVGWLGGLTGWVGWVGCVVGWLDGWLGGLVGWLVLAAALRAVRFKSRSRISGGCGVRRDVLSAKRQKRTATFWTSDCSDCGVMLKQ